MPESISIRFTVAGGAGELPIVIELDNEMNDGRTEFLFGSRAYFKIFSPPGVNYQLRSSDGTILGEGNGLDTIKEYISFIEEKTATVSKPVVGPFTFTWLGVSLGNIIKKNFFEVECEKQPGVENGCGIAYVEYQTQFNRYSITVQSPANDIKEYEVLVVAYG